MSQNTQDLNNDGPSPWFPEPLSDEAAFSIHLFLKKFSYQFEGAYYNQIKRHIDAEKSARQPEYDPVIQRDDDIYF